MKRALLLMGRFTFVWMLHGVALLAVHVFVPGVALEARGGIELVLEALAVALVLAVLNGSVRPALIWLTLPVNMVTLGFFTLVIDALMLQIVAWVLPFLVINGFGFAVLGSLVITAVSTFLGNLTAVNSHFSFFDGVVEWLAPRLTPPAPTDERGILVLEIDGLSYECLCRALGRGLMPYLRSLLEDGYALTPYDCGVPSQTSSSQAGIMFGSSDEIPGFRWYDKAQRRVISSRNSADARAIEEMVAHGEGLLVGGSSINNNLSGGAAETVITTSRGLDTSSLEQQRGMEDLCLYFMNPYLFSRSVLLGLIETVREILQSLRRRVRREQPQLDWALSGFPAERAACTVILRDISTFLAIVNILKGVPAAYVTYVGYDEVAHHVGPDSRDSLAVLRGIDSQIRRIHQVLLQRAPRPYELFVLSDHGQERGATFRQRYGVTVAELIDRLLRDRGRAVQPFPEGERIASRELARELEQAVPRLTAEGVRITTVAQARRLLDRKSPAAREEKHAAAAESETGAELQEADVVVCATGNLAHVYFTAWDGHATVDELEARFPALLWALAHHPGIGLVVGRDEAGRAWAYGPEGDRCLDDGMVLGEDPLCAYDRPEIRAAQLLRLCGYRHSGDLILFSTVYEDGSVASFEELVGSHGGMGGRQTHAFVVHPAEVVVPETTTAADLHPVLVGRRGLVAPAADPPLAAQSRVPDSALESLRPTIVLTALRRPRRSFGLLGRSLLVDRSAFRELAAQPELSGVAVVLGVLVTIAFGVKELLDPTPLLGGAAGFLVGVGQGFLTWAGLILVGVLVGRLSGAHVGAGAALRTLGFAAAPLVFTPLLALPPLSSALSITLLLWVTLTWWVALGALMPLKRPARWLAPLAAVLVIVGSATLIAWAVGALHFTIVWLTSRLGLSGSP